jgi:hypothetical protein
MSGKMYRAKGKLVVPTQGATRRGPNSVTSFTGGSHSSTEKKRGESLTACGVFGGGVVT